ncbi:MAG: thioredoxin [Planctomycetota bacterium]|nr:thioredoxin [Planctomycetota bacterium]
MAGTNTLEFTDDNFDKEVLQSTTPVLVDFWAEWCAPCRMIGPTIDAVADATIGKAKVGKVNVDHARNVAVKYGIMSIPTLLVFKDGKMTQKFVGANVNKDQLVGALA